MQAEAIKGIGLAFPIAANDQGEAWASVIDLVGSQLQYNVWLSKGGGFISVKFSL